MTTFEDISNELILSILDQLPATDVIYSFSNLNNRFQQLLFEFYGLNQRLDIRYCALSTFRYFSHQISKNDQWRLNLTALKLGCRYRCSQTDLLANAVAQSFVTQHYTRKGMQCSDLSPRLFRLILTYNKHLEPFFPQLKSLFVFQSVSMEEDTRDILLHIVAGGSAMRTFTWRTCSFQTHHAQSFFDWLFKRVPQLNSFWLENTIGEKAFDLTYQQTLAHDYHPHNSLTSVTINLLSLSSLSTLLHYVPNLEYLDVHITNTIESANITDENLTHPQQLRQLTLRAFQIKHKGRYQLEHFIEKFAASLQTLSLSLYHRSDRDIDQYYNGSSLQNLCEKLSHLQSIDFAIEVQLFQRATNETITYYTKTFSTPYWLNGPFGCKKVCVDFHQLYWHLQMFSLPYTFTNGDLFRTINVVNTQFNTCKEINPISRDIPRALEPLWSGMRRLFASIDKYQQIPLSFLEALQYSRRHGKILNIREKRGVMPENVEDKIQLVHFNTLELDGFTVNDPYNLQELLAWFRLLPNISCLRVNIMELKFWFTIVHGSRYLDSCLQRIERLSLDCSLIITAEMNEEIMKLLLDFLIEQRRFPRLRCVRFRSCKHISSAWVNINQWLDFFLAHITEHQLRCIRFDFIEKESEVTDLQTSNETIITVDPEYRFDIHRFVHANHVALWIDRK